MSKTRPNLNGISVDAKWYRRKHSLKLMALLMKLSRFLPSTLTLSMLVLMPSLPYAQARDSTSIYPNRLPYRFTNFVWWSDPELRAELKQRIPTLDDQIKPNSSIEAAIRNTLTSLLKQKGISAQVQTEEPSATSFSGERAPGAPPPAILFSILSPPILVEKLVFENPPPEMTSSFTNIANQMTGKPYVENPWNSVQQIEQALKQKGYLQAKVVLNHEPPQKVEEHYSVVVHTVIDSGSLFHVGSLSADGGPLVQNKSLSPYFSVQVGDIARPDAFERLAGVLRPLYWRAGYADVEVQVNQTLDASRGLATYNLRVIPGPVYHLRSLKIRNLDSVHESQVRVALGLKPGDIYDELSVTNLNIRLAKTVPSLADYNFSWHPAKDTGDHVVDLTLDFFKQ